MKDLQRFFKRNIRLLILSVIMIDFIACARIAIQSKHVEFLYLLKLFAIIFLTAFASLLVLFFFIYFLSRTIDNRE